MAWKLFGKSKSEEKEPVETEDTIDEETEEDIEIEQEIEQESENKPLAEHYETLQTGAVTSKKSKATKPSDQRVWRDVNAIENKIDKLHITRAQKPVNELDKTVDRIIEKGKK